MASTTSSTPTTPTTAATAATAATASTPDPPGVGPPPCPFPLRRGHLLIIGTGAFSVSSLPGRVALLRAWYGHAIRVCLTMSAAALVSANALAAASRHPVAGPDWHTGDGTVVHRELAAWADLVIVDPATAAFVGKCAYGITDSLALMVVMATEAPVVIAPSMPASVLNRPSTRRSLDLLRNDGFHVISPEPAFSMQTGSADGVGVDLLSVVESAARTAGSR